MEEYFETISRLRNFTCEFKEIQLSDDITIRIVNKDDIKTFRNYKEEGILNRNKFVLCNKFKNQKNIDSGDDNSIRIMFRCCDALRLITYQSIGLGDHIYVKKMPENVVVYKSDGDPRMQTFNYKYELKKKNIEELKMAFTMISEIYLGKDGRIGEALSRLRFSYEHGTAHSPIDLMTGFESLFLSGEQELRYKLATRASFLLGRSVEERKYIYKKLTWTYNYRSKLVHGSWRIETTDKKI